MVELDWTLFANFSRSEFECKCSCGKCEMDESFVKRLQHLRKQCGFPFVISSGYRCPNHNARVSSTGSVGPHTTGHAVDIVCSGENAVKLTSGARLYGMTGIGVKQHGPHGKRFIHLDDLQNAVNQPRPWIWSYS